MIGLIRGRLADRDPSGSVTVDVNGVGYEISVTAPTAAALGALGDEVTLRVHTRVREDAITLFGFVSAEEKRCFDALLSAHGVGPSVALALLTVHSPSALRQIIAFDDVEALSQVPGIGKKTATRMLVELKSKFEVDIDDGVVDLGAIATTPGVSSTLSDVSAALSSLGYGGDEIRAVLNELPEAGSVEELLRQALRRLAKSRQATA